MRSALNVLQQTTTVITSGYVRILTGMLGLNQIILRISTCGLLIMVFKRLDAVQNILNTGVLFCDSSNTEFRNKRCGEKDSHNDCRGPLLGSLYPLVKILAFVKLCKFVRFIPFVTGISGDGCDDSHVDKS